MSGGEPLVFALSDDCAAELDEKLLGSGAVGRRKLAGDSTVVVNFAHVVTAHLDELLPLTRVYGSDLPKKHGFAT